MKILVNYDAHEKRFLPALAHLLRRQGITAQGTSDILSASELVHTAREANCTSILIANESTLRNLVTNPKATLDNYRGSRLNLSVPCVIGNKLHQIHTVNYGEFLAKNDIKKLSSTLPVPRFAYTVLKDQSTYPTVLQEMKQSILTAYDIETVTVNEDIDNLKAGDTLITCAGWSILLPTGQIKTYVLPLIDFLHDHWTTDLEYSTAIQFLRDANKTQSPKVMHNGIYDCTHSIVYHAEPYNYNLDTMALAHSEYTELPKTLDFVASLHLDDYIQWKDDAESASKTKDIEKYWRYNAKDCWHTLRICISQLRNLPVYAQTNFATKFKLTFPSLYCAFEGFNIDQQQQDSLREQAKANIDKHRHKLRVLVDDPDFNPGSWQQVQKVIYQEFGAAHPRVGKSKSGTDEKNLKVVAEQHPLLALLVDSILEYRGSVKALGTYYNFLQKEGRLLWNLNPFGAETERMSCRASSFWCGTQVQNIPYYAKGQLTADEGFELIEVDNSQSEGRCTAYLAQDLALIKALEDPDYDFYKTLGTLFFNIPYEEVTDFFRNKVLKKIVHGTNYMMGAKTFKENASASILHEAASFLGYKIIENPNKRRKEEKTMLEFCKELLEKYHKPFPRVRQWYKEIQAEILTTGQLESPLGHVRVFFGDIKQDHNMLRSAVAHQPQNLSVHILNIGMWQVYKELVVEPKAPIEVGDYRMKAQVHDSVLSQYRISKRDIIVQRMLELMDNSVMIKGRELRIPVDAKIGNSWGTCEDYKG